MSNNLPATCLSGWAWASNSLNQNPCVIAGALEAPCRNISEYILGPLQPGDSYVPPQKGDTLAQTCECNTVIYSLFMACIACQNQTIEPWSLWDQNCPVVHVDQYPGVIPNGTAVPHWAFLNVTTGDTFNRTLAQAAGRDPESTSSGSSPSTALSPSSSSSSIPSSSSSSSPSPSSSLSSSGSPASKVSSSSSAASPSKSTSSGSRSNAGPIPGGVVGRMAFGTMIATIAWYLVQ